MEQRTLAVIEIASSKIKGAVGAVGPDGSLAVLAVEETPAVNNVRYGRIQNIRDVSTAVDDIVRRLEAAPGVAPRRITSMALSIGGRSLSATPARAAIKFASECEITEAHVRQLIHEATRDFVGNKNIEDMVPRMFYVNNAATRRAVGFFGETFKGEFMMVTCGKETRQNLDRLKFETVHRDDTDYILRPTAVADLVLTPDEREVGVILVDIGAETSTVSIYKDGTLAFLSTLPMGSRLISLDLMTALGVTEETAQGYKHNIKDVATGPGGEEIYNYVRARAGEITANIVNQIDTSGVDIDPKAAIVLTGGGAKLDDFATLLTTMTRRAVRVAHMPQSVTFRVAGRNNADNIDIVALLARAAATFTWDCLTSPAAAETVTDTDGYDDEDAPIIAKAEVKTTSRPDKSHAPYVRDITAAGKPSTKAPVQEDDDDLLDDDEDDEIDDTDEKESGGESGRRHGFSFFGLGRRKNRDKDLREADDEPEEEIDDEEEEVQDEEPAHEPTNSERAGSLIDSMTDRLSRIFESRRDDDDEF